MPSTSTSVKSDSPPRGKSDVTHRADRVGDGFELPVRDVPGRHHRHRVGSPGQRQLDVRGGHDHGFGERADVEAHGDVERAAGTDEERPRVRPEPRRGHAELVTARREPLEAVLSQGVGVGRRHGAERRDEQHPRMRDPRAGRIRHNARDGPRRRLRKSGNADHEQQQADEAAEER
jgi:hypothetical protein